MECLTIKQLSALGITLEVATREQLEHLERCERCRRLVEQVRKEMRAKLREEFKGK